MDFCQFRILFLSLSASKCSQRSAPLPAHPGGSGDGDHSCLVWSVSHSTLLQVDLLQVGRDVPCHDIVMFFLPPLVWPLPTPTASCPNFHIHSWLPSHATRGWCGDSDHQLCSAAAGWSSDSSWGRQSPLQAPTLSTLSHSDTWVWMKGSVKLPTVNLVWGQDIIEYDPSDLFPHVSSLCGVWGKGIPLGWPFPLSNCFYFRSKGYPLKFVSFP